jgi:hypothetical protein
MEVALTSSLLNHVLLYDWLALIVTHALIVACIYNLTCIYFQCLAIEWHKNCANWVDYALWVAFTNRLLCVYFATTITILFLIVSEFQGYQ